MDYSLFTYKQQVERMIDELRRFSNALRHHVIIQPKNVLDESIRYGLPTDIAYKYMRYYNQNKAVAEDIIRYINNTCIPYLSDIARYIGNATVRDNNQYSTYYTNTYDHQSIPSSNDVTAYRIYQSIQQDAAITANNKQLEEALGIQQGQPMTIDQADKQNANPFYTPRYIAAANGEYYFYKGEYYLKKELPTEAFNHPESIVLCRKNPNYNRAYSVNCATCAAAFVLRLRGFDITAKGNPETDGNRNTWLSDCHSFDIWSKPDGSKPSPSYYSDWMKQNGIYTMSSQDYQRFFEQNCKEHGIYVVTLAWKGTNGRAYDGGHAAIIQSDSEGLHYIEPQVYDCCSDDGRLDMINLIQGMADIQPQGKGVLRVDDKLFDPAFIDLFNT